MSAADLILPPPAEGSREVAERVARAREIQAERFAEAQPFRERRRVAVHHHVHQGFDLGRLAGLADVAQTGAQRFEQGLGSVECLLPSSAHEIERALTGLRDAAGHAGFYTGSAMLLDQRFDFDMDAWGDRRAVDEEAIFCIGKETG